MTSTFSENLRVSGNSKKIWKRWGSAIEKQVFVLYGNEVANI